MTGVWAVKAATAGEYLAPVSFAAPLPAAIASTDVHYVGSGATPPECENAARPGTGSVTNPEAAAGEFCIYSSAGFGGTFLYSIDAGETEEGIGTHGGVLAFDMTVAGSSGFGSWAVSE